VKEVTYPSGSVIVGMRYTLDDMSRPTTIERKLSTAVEGISTSAWETAATVKYHGHREVERVQAPYDLKRTQSWTSFKEPDTLEYKENTTPFGLLTGLASQWNADGQMVVRERMHDEAGGYEWGEVFRYDGMGRLTKMWYDVRNPSGFSSTDPVEGTNPYDLRKAWNLGKVYERDSVVIKEYNQTAATTTYSVNSHYQVTAGPAAMQWSNNGYMTDRGVDDFAWTALGQLEQAAISGGSTLDYTYDAFGRRVKTVNGSQTNRFLYHGWHMIGEYDVTADGWLWQEAPWNRGERMLEHIALDTNDLDTDENVSEYRQYAVHEDFQDTVWGLSDGAAAIAERYHYTDPYGESVTKDGSGTGIGDFATQVFHRKRMHGGFVELESELYDFRNRWLLDLAGLWTSNDPIGTLISENLLQTFRANPLMHSDPFGLADCPTGSTKVGERDGVTYCVDLDANKSDFKGDCEGKDGCTTAEFQVPPPSTVITTRIDPSGLSALDLYLLQLHEMWHAAVIAECHNKCTTGFYRVPSDYKVWIACIGCCMLARDLNRVSEEVMACKAEIFLSLPPGGIGPLGEEQ